MAPSPPTMQAAHLYHGSQELSCPQGLLFITPGGLNSLQPRKYQAASYISDQHSAAVQEATSLPDIMMTKCTLLLPWVSEHRQRWSATLFYLLMPLCLNTPGDTLRHCSTCPCRPPHTRARAPLPLGSLCRSYLAWPPPAPALTCLRASLAHWRSLPSLGTRTSYLAAGHRPGEDRGSIECR